MIKVLIATSTFNKKILNILKTKKKFTIIVNKTGKKISENFLRKNISNADVIIAGTEIYNEAILKKAKKIKVNISNW